MNDVLMYSTSFCPYCVRARHLLEAKSIQYTTIRVDDSPDLWTEMEKKSGASTVPQIFIDGKSVGGCDDLFALESSGQLDKLLGIG